MLWKIIYVKISPCFEEDSEKNVFLVLMSSQNTVTSCGMGSAGVILFQMHPHFSTFTDKNQNKFWATAKALLLSVNIHPFQSFFCKYRFV